MLTATLITRGSPTQLTGGHLYQWRMAQAAPTFGFALELVQASLRRDPLRIAADVVIVDSITAWSVTPWVLARRRAVPLLAAVAHQPPGGIGHRTAHTAIQRRLDRAMYRRCDLVIAASSSLADELARCHGVASERICVVEPGSDLPAPRPHDPREADLRRGRRIAVLCVASWHAAKGVLELLDAVAALAPDDVTLHLAGRDDVDAAYSARVRERLHASDLADRVVTYGGVDPARLAGLYAGADVFVLPSYTEAYGTVYGEALRAGLPTLGWRAGNLPNLIEDGREGYLLTTGDVAALTSALSRLAGDDAVRLAMAAAASERGRSLPTWEAAAERFFALLTNLVARSG